MLFICANMIVVIIFIFDTLKLIAIKVYYLIDHKFIKKKLDNSNNQK